MLKHIFFFRHVEISIRYVIFITVVEVFFGLVADFENDNFNLKCCLSYSNLIPFTKDGTPI